MQGQLALRSNDCTHYSSTQATITSLRASTLSDTLLCVNTRDTLNGFDRRVVYRYPSVDFDRLGGRQSQVQSVEPSVLHYNS